MSEQIEWTLEEAYRYASLIMGTAAGQGRTYDALLWALEQLNKTTIELAESVQRIRQLSDERYVYLVRAKQAEAALQWEQIQHAETLQRTKAANA